MTAHQQHALHEIATDDLRERLARHDIILVDIRETHEFASGTFIARCCSRSRPSMRWHRQPIPRGRSCCNADQESLPGWRLRGAASVHIDTHLIGEIAAWKAAGLPTLALDPGTEVAVDRQ